MWIAIALLICASVLIEAAGTIGKIEIRKKIESVFSMSFLNMFWSFGVFGAILVFRPDAWRFSVASIPLLIIRLILDCFQVYWTGKALSLASRGTFGLVRTLTIPLVLLAEVALGYQLSALQLIGVSIVSLTLMLLGSLGDIEKKGIQYVLLSAINAAMTITLFKFSITHYNSIPTDQFIVTAGLLVFLYVMARRKGERPFQLLRTPMIAGQSAAFGTASLLSSLTMGVLPASIATTFSRALDVFWSIVFGKAYFKETHVVAKLIGCAAIVIGLVLLAR